MKRLLIPVLFLTSAALIGNAQIRDAHKPVLPAAVGDSLISFSHVSRYAEFDRKVGNLYEFTPYDALRIKPADPVRQPVFNATLGVQFPLSPSFSAGFGRTFGNNFWLGVSGNHNSFFSGVPSGTSEKSVGEKFTDNGVKGDLKYAWSEGEFSLNLQYDYSTRFFNSQDELFTAFHNRNIFGLKAGISSSKADKNNLYFDFSFDFHALEAGCSDTSIPERRSLSENSFSLSGYVGTTFDVHRVYVDMNMEIVSYSNLKNYSTALVEFSPFYEYKNRRFSGKFGVKFGNRFGEAEQRKKTKMEDGNDITAVSSVFPNVDARLEIVRKWLWAHLSATGGYDMNSYSSIARDCPILMPDTPLRLGSRPVDITLSLESVVFGRFAVNASGRFAMVRNKPVLSPVMDDGLRAANGIYEIRAWDMDFNNFTFAAEALWKSSSVTLGGEFRYNRYWRTESEKSGENATELPRFTSKVYFRYNWRERIVFAADFNYFSATYGDRWGYYQVPSIHDLNLRLTFNVNRHFSIFAKCGNLLNSGNQYIPMYYGASQNFGGGVSLAF